jgi:hypothetical protein
MDDLEPEFTFGNRLRVEICVRAGENHGVDLTTQVELADYKDRVASGARLTEVITLLWNAVPLNLIKSTEKEFAKDSGDVGVGADGKLTLLAKGSVEAQAAINDLKKGITIHEPAAETARPVKPAKL